MTHSKIILSVFLAILLYQPNAHGQWIHSSVINQGFVSAVAVKDSIIFLGGYDLSDSARSCFYSTDYGNTWTECFNPLALWPNAIVITDNYIFTGEGFEGGYIFRSADWGLTWEDCSPQYIGYTAMAYCDSSLYAGTTTDNCPGGVWKSTDNGDTWTESWFGASCGNHSIITLDSLVFVAAGSAGVYGSFDYGNTWVALNTGFIDPPGIICLALSNYTIFAGSGGSETENRKVYYTTDLGSNWQPANDGLNSSYIQGLAADHDHLFAASLKKVYMLQQQDMKWQDITADLPVEYIQGLAVYGDQLICYGSTGIWYRSISAITGIDEKMGAPQDFNLGQNYPNPFNPVTTIEYSLPNTGRVTVKIHDLLGREITELVNEFKSAGRHRIQFNGSSLASGIYFYSIEAGQYRQVRKMALIK
jgi:hypothetical protein